MPIKEKLQINSIVNQEMLIKEMPIYSTRLRREDLIVESEARLGDSHVGEGGASPINGSKVARLCARLGREELRLGKEPRV